MAAIAYPFLSESGEVAPQQRRGGCSGRYALALYSWRKRRKLDEGDDSSASRPCRSSEDLKRLVRIPVFRAVAMRRCSLLVS